MASSTRSTDRSGLPAVRLDGVSKRFAETTAVDEVDLDVRDGEFFTMLGPSGSGKTTLLRIVAGFEAADAGRIELHGSDVTAKPPYQRDVNTVFQDYALFPHMSVRDNVEYGLRVKKIPRGRRHKQAAEALELVGLKGMEKRKPTQLSGGQRQRVALARAVVNHPRVLLLDEPLGALDLKLRQAMQLELKRIQREAGITFLYVTHDQEEALTMSDRVAVFHEGRVVQVGKPAEVYEFPATPYVAGFIGVSNLLTHAGTQYVVRPERLRLLPPEERVPDGATSAQGTVSDVIYLGMVTRFIVRLDEGGTVNAVEQNTGGGLPRHTDSGRRVRVCWWPDRAHPLNQAGTPAMTHREHQAEHPTAPDGEEPAGSTTTAEEITR